MVRESKPTLSIVVPLRNEKPALVELYQRVKAALEHTSEDWELVLVDDGSQDQTTEALAFLCAQDSCVRGIRLTRNFGFQIAATAGIDAARGCAVILMNPDLQDPPEVIPELVNRWRAGFDVVYGVRTGCEGQNRLQRAAVDWLYRLIRRLVAGDIPLDTPDQIRGDFRLMDRRVVDAIKQMPERHRCLRGMVSWIGFKQASVVCVCQPHGAVRQFTLRKMLSFALDAITGFSRLPLRLAAYFGMASVLSGTLAMAAAFGLGLAGTDGNWPGQMITLAVVLLVGGSQLVCMGIAGEYLGRMYDEMKQRPLYLVDQCWGFTEQVKR